MAKYGKERLTNFKKFCLISEKKFWSHRITYIRENIKISRHTRALQCDWFSRHGMIVIGVGANRHHPTRISSLEIFLQWLNSLLPPPPTVYWTPLHAVILVYQIFNRYIAHLRTKSISSHWIFKIFYIAYLLYTRAEEGQYTAASPPNSDSGSALENLSKGHFSGTLLLRYFYARAQTHFLFCRSRLVTFHTPCQVGNKVIWHPSVGMHNSKLVLTI